MTKKVIGIVGFNAIMVIFVLSMFYIGPLSLNFTNIDVSPIRFSFSMAFTTFWFGTMIYVDNNFVKYLSTLKIRNYKVKDQPVEKMSVARCKMQEAKRNNSNLEKYIGESESLLISFQDKNNIIKELLANHGEKVSDWDWINEGTDVAQKEIFEYIRVIYDSAIVFNNDNFTQQNLTSAIDKISAANVEIKKIIDKYDEFINLVQQVLERNLHTSAIVATESLDITIKSVKQVYCIDQKDELAELLAKYQVGEQNG